MKLMTDFRDFLIKQNALALAIGVIIGGATGKLVSGIVDDLIMPIVGLILPAGDWREAQWVLSGNNSIKYGDMIGRLIDFIAIAAVVFPIVKFILKDAMLPAPAAPAPPPPPPPETRIRPEGDVKQAPSR